MSFMEDFQHLKVQLEDVKSATNNFGQDKRIGSGGFGQVYKGELACSKGQSVVAFKRLDRKHGQGDTEFWKEIMMLSRYRHENLVSLLHFCNDGAERILVYEYASRGSLDRYLSDSRLTWIQRLEICVGAARGLNYLHDPMETQQRVLHRDVKSSNILLDEEWTAKVSDFGLSKIGPANQPNTFLVSDAVGTFGYCDPLYWENGFLSKESDVYSFGVVLFEVMSGKLCYEYINGQLCHILVPTWKKCYEEKRFDDIIYPELKKQMDWDSLNTYSNIAYRCLKIDQRERPMMAEIVKKLELALEQQVKCFFIWIRTKFQEKIMDTKIFLQELFEDPQERKHHDEMTKIADLAVPKLSYGSPKELFLLLSKGILVDDGTTWFTLNKNRKNCEMISATNSMVEYPMVHVSLKTTKGSRFQNLIPYSTDSNFEIKVSTKFLSPHVTYTINLIYKLRSYDQLSFRFHSCHRLHVPFAYKLDEETEYWTSCVAYTRKGQSLVTELYQFTSCQKEHKFRIQVGNKLHHDGVWHLYMEGIEFRPVEYDEDENMEDMQQVTYSETDWEQKFPNDYMEMIKQSKDNVQWTTKKELYCLLRNGLLVNNGKQWLSISKNMKKRYMLPARTILREKKSIGSFLTRRKSWTWKPLQESRFHMAAEFLNTNCFSLVYKINWQLLSPETTYACYLVYKLPESLSMSTTLLYLKNAFYGLPKYYPMYLLTPPHTPIIKSMVNPMSHGSSRTRKIKGHPKLRKDGWMEIQIGQIDKYVYTCMNLHFVSCNEWKCNGLLVQGIEFRPMKVSLKHPSPYKAIRRRI